MNTDRLYLFDIDATLLVTAGAGIRAMELAGRDLFRSDFSVDGIDFAGRLDPLLLDEMLLRNSVAEAGAHDRLRHRYAERLPAVLAASDQARALPGVHDLLSALTGVTGAVVGLLTGNFRETGHIKLRHCGIDPTQFSPAVWGDESPHRPPSRDHLPAVAMTRHASQNGGAIHPSRVVIIGDTPHDARCAKTNGCRCLGVATGKYGRDDLMGAGADAVVADLSDTGRIVRLLGEL